VGTIHQPIVVIGDIDVACANAGRGFMAAVGAKTASRSGKDIDPKQSTAAVADSRGGGFR
jgi:hypothetical protein